MVSLFATPARLHAAFDPWHAGSAAASVLACAASGPVALATMRERRLRELLRAARASKVYADALAPQGEDTPLEALPIMRKRELMARFDDWVTDPALRLAGLRRFLAEPASIGETYLGRYAVWESSGSTGEPGVYVNDAASLAVQDALESLRRAPLRPGWRFLDPWYLGERIVFVGAGGGHFASVASMARLRRLNPVLAPRLHALSFLQPLPELIEALQSCAPTILSTYPTTALILAEERQAGRLRISPREVWTGGETLTPAMRAFVGQAFDCPVSNDYGCSEFLALATECRLQRLHLNADWAILESVDDRGRPVPAGEAGTRTLLTNLANRVQPLLRYELGDRVTLHDARCACGSLLPVIEVTGRSDDLLALGDPAEPTTLSPLALCTVLEDVAGLHDFQLVQRGTRRLQLTSRLGGAASRRDLERGRAALQAFLHAQGISGVRLECRCGEPVRLGPGGKIKRVLAAVPVGVDDRARPGGQTGSGTPEAGHRARRIPAR